MVDRQAIPQPRRFEEKLADGCFWLCLACLLAGCLQNEALGTGRGTEKSILLTYIRRLIISKCLGSLFRLLFFSKMINNNQAHVELQELFLKRHANESKASAQVLLNQTIQVV